MNGLRSLTLQEENALAVLADAVDRCRKEDMRTPEVLASLDLLARGTSICWPFDQFKESLNFAIGDPSHAEGRWQNVHASLNTIRFACTPSTGEWACVRSLLPSGFCSRSEPLLLPRGHQRANPESFLSAG
jgi:hypothetical protein